MGLTGVLQLGLADHLRRGGFRRGSTDVDLVRVEVVWQTLVFFAVLGSLFRVVKLAQAT